MPGQRLWRNVFVLYVKLNTQHPLRDIFIRNEMPKIGNTCYLTFNKQATTLKLPQQNWKIPSKKLQER